jgi:glutaredoxin
VTSLPGVVVYVASGCHLCEAALEVVANVRTEIPFTLEVIDVAGDAALETAHREYLPVVEIDGVRSFTYFVHPAALAERLLSACSSSGRT